MLSTGTHSLFTSLSPEQSFDEAEMALQEVRDYVQTDEFRAAFKSKHEQLAERVVTPVAHDYKHVHEMYKTSAVGKHGIITNNAQNGRYLTVFKSNEALPCSRLDEAEEAGETYGLVHQHLGSSGEVIVEDAAEQITVAEFRKRTCEELRDLFDAFLEVSGPKDLFVVPGDKLAWSCFLEMVRTKFPDAKAMAASYDPKDLGEGKTMLASATLLPVDLDTEGGSGIVGYIGKYQREECVSKIANLSPYWPGAHAVAGNGVGGVREYEKTAKHGTCRHAVAIREVSYPVVKLLGPNACAALQMPIGRTDIVILVLHGQLRIDALNSEGDGVVNWGATGSYKIFTDQERKDFGVQTAVLLPGDLAVVGSGGFFQYCSEGATVLEMVHSTGNKLYDWSTWGLYITDVEEAIKNHPDRAQLLKPLRSTAKKIVAACEMDIRYRGPAREEEPAAQESGGEGDEGEEDGDHESGGEGDEEDPNGDGDDDDDDDQ